MKAKKITDTLISTLETKNTISFVSIMLTSDMVGHTVIMRQL